MVLRHRVKVRIGAIEGFASPLISWDDDTTMGVHNGSVLLAEGCKFRHQARSNRHILADNLQRVLFAHADYIADR